MKDEINDIREILTRHLAGEASPAEAGILSAWRRQSQDNEQEYQKSKKVFEAATRHYKKAIVPDINVEKEWDVFVSKVDSAPVRQLTPSAWAGFVRIAATLLLLIVSGAVIYYYATKTETLTVQTAGNTQRIELPDGSAVTLNRNSTLHYESNFGKANRNVSLRGEAFFDVKKDDTLPFVITARNTTIEVVGTSFNVLAYDSLADVEVTVKTGVVRFSVASLNKTIELTAGEKGEYAEANNRLDENMNDDINYESWNTRKLSFSETHLSTVIETINRTYNAHIVITGPVSDSCLLTVSFDNQSLEAVLNVLENTLNLTYRHTGNQIEIISAGC